MEVYIPAGLVRKSLPPHLIKFKDDIRVFLNLLYEKQVLGKKSGFINLKVDLIRKQVSFRKFTDIRRYLLEKGIIECDGVYITGKKSLGYRLGLNYQKDNPVRVPLVKKVLIKKLEERAKAWNLRRSKTITKDQHRYLFSCLEKVEFLSEDLTSSSSQKISLDRIRHKEWFFSVDLYGRVHSNVTNIKAKNRMKLEVDGKRLIELDIQNSQAYFLGLDLIHCLLSNKTPSSPPKLLDAFEDPLKSCRDISENGNIVNPFLPEDVRDYMDVVCNGDLYDELYKQRKHSKVLLTRKQLKKQLFIEVFFGEGNRKTRFINLFEKRFPNVMKFIRAVKRQDYTQLSKRLQKIESFFVIEKIVGHFMREGRFVLTVHDSFLVKKQDLEFTKDVVRSVFEPFGFQPTLRIKNEKIPLEILVQKIIG